MAKKSEVSGTKLGGTNEAEELSALNAETGRRSNPAEQLRRKLEATIEAKTRKRRRREAPRHLRGSDKFQEVLYF